MKDTKPTDRIVVEKGPPGTFLSAYHVTREVTVHGLQKFCYKPIQGYEKTGDDGGTLLRSEEDKTKSLVFDLFDIPGVTNVSISRYQVNVTYDLAFEAESIEKQVLQTLTNVLFGGLQPELYDYNDGRFERRSWD